MSTATATQDRLLTTGQAAELTGLAQHRVMRWIDRLGLAAGEVGGNRVRIVRESDLPKITAAAARGRWPKD